MQQIDIIIIIIMCAMVAERAKTLASFFCARHARDQGLRPTRAGYIRYGRKLWAREARIGPLPSVGRQNENQLSGWVILVAEIV